MAVDGGKRYVDTVALCAPFSLTTPLGIKRAVKLFILADHSRLRPHTIYNTFIKLHLQHNNRLIHSIIKKCAFIILRKCNLYVAT